MLPFAQLLQSLQSHLLIFLNFFCSISCYLLGIFEFSSRYRIACSFCSNHLVSFERFRDLLLAPQSLFWAVRFYIQKLFSLVRTICSLFSKYLDLSSGLRLVLKFSSLFQAVCTLISSSLFERFSVSIRKLFSPFRAVCSFLSNFWSLSFVLLFVLKTPSIVWFERIIPGSQIA